MRRDPAFPTAARRCPRDCPDPLLYLDGRTWLCPCCGHREAPEAQSCHAVGVESVSPSQEPHRH